MMKQGDKITYTAQFYTNAETAGVVGDTTVFVPNMIVGERAVVGVSYAKKDVAYAYPVEIVDKSVHRQEPQCPHFGKCGGCALMHMDYAEQLVFKRNKVVQNLKKIGGIDFPVQPCVPSPCVVGYRNKLSLPVRGKVGNVKVGMFQKNTHTVVDTDKCLLGGDWCAKLVKIFRKYCNENSVVPYNEKTFGGEVRHLVARYVDGQLLVTVVSNGPWKHDFTPLVDALKGNFEKFGLFCNVNIAKNNVILGENTQHVFGLQYIQGNHLGVSFRLRPDSFFQVNNGVKDAIYSKVKELLDLSGTEVLLDCFSGIGILTNILASDKYDTYALELDASAVSDANQLCKLNNTPRTTNLCGDANVLLPQLTKRHLGKNMSLVVDPPRKGLGEKICSTILQAGFDNIVYVSCDSATLARDLKALSVLYQIDCVLPFDMFPQTAEVETLVHLKHI